MNSLGVISDFDGCFNQTENDMQTLIKFKKCYIRTHTSNSTYVEWILCLAVIHMHINYVRDTKIRLYVSNCFKNQHCNMKFDLKH